MNRKFSVLLIVVSLFAASLFIVGCDGDDGDRGERGVMGITGPSGADNAFMQSHDTDAHVDTLIDSAGAVSTKACEAGYHATTALGGICRDVNEADVKGCVFPQAWDDTLTPPACA